MSEENVRRLSRIRSLKRRKNPTFRAQNSWRYKRVNPKWRRPRGIDSKMQEKRRGWPHIVKVGYRKPRLVRNLHYSQRVGVREEFIVKNLTDLQLVLPNKHVVRIGSNVGLRKRELIFQEAKSWGLDVINPIRITEESGEVSEDLSLDRTIEDLDLDLEDLESDQEELEDSSDNDKNEDSNDSKEKNDK